MYDVNEFHFNKDECWFKSACESFNDTEYCNCACPVYVQFFYLVNLANIPKPLQYPCNLRLSPGKDSKEYTYLEGIRKDIVNWVKEGNNLYLFSESPGNGKTTWACKLMLAYFYKIYEGNGLECRGLFLNVDEFIYKKKQTISRPDLQFSEMEKLIPTVDLVIWDDIGMTTLTDYEYAMLYTLLNQRICNGKANIFTSNVIDNELYANVGSRIGDRILNTSDVIEFINPSQRKPARERGRK